MPDVVRLSKRAHLGVLVLLRLARSKTPLSLRTIAEHADISEGYLEEVAAKLRKAGMIRARRGAQGGYMLSKKPSDISFMHIVEALEGSMALTPCLDDKEKCFSSCSGRCATKSVMQEAQDALVSSLSKIKLADIH